MTGKPALPVGVLGVVIARNALLNLAALGLSLIVAFLTLPIIISGLGKEQFGMLAILFPTGRVPKDLALMILARELE